MNDQYGVSPSYEKKITWGFLLTETYRIYSQRFWTLFRIGLPIAAHTDQGLGILVAALGSLHLHCCSSGITDLHHVFCPSSRIESQAC